MTKIIRTKTKATGGITPKEKAKLDLVAKEWIDIALRTEPIEKEKITAAIKGLYSAAKLKEPRVVIVSSPLVMAAAYGASAWIWYCRKNAATIEATYVATSAATSAATRAATDAATRAATRAATIEATDAATIEATRAATRAATIEATYVATSAATIKATTAIEKAAFAVCFELAGKGGIECAKKWANAYQGGNMWAGWCAYIAGFRDVLGLELEEHKNYRAYEDAARHGGFRVIHEEFCIVSDFPEVLKVDEQNRPHCETGPSHKWRDGWALYHWHGVRIPQEWIEDKANLTPQVALTWGNIEQRRAACEIIGWNKILAELNATVIDEDGDPEIGTLVEVDLPDSGKERFLRVLCGTGREFALPVPPNMETAIQASAWTYGIDKLETYKPEVRT